MSIAVEESVCQWCGAPIYLVRESINNWEWVTDLKRPRTTWKCFADAEWPAARLHQPVLLDRDAVKAKSTTP
jgi:Zn-finger protein